MAEPTWDGIAPSTEPGPKPGSVLGVLEKLSEVANRLMAWAAGLILAAIMLYTVAGMTLRALGHTFAGSYEVIGWLSAAAMTLALGTVQRQRGHVAIDIVTVRLGRGARRAVELVNSLLSFLLFATVSWYVVSYGRTLQETGSLSETLRVIVYPWVYVVAVGCVGLTLALLVDFLRAARK